MKPIILCINKIKVCIWQKQWTREIFALYKTQVFLIRSLLPEIKHKSIVLPFIFPSQHNYNIDKMQLETTLVYELFYITFNFLAKLWLFHQIYLAVAHFVLVNKYVSSWQIKITTRWSQCWIASLHLCWARHMVFIIAADPNTSTQRTYPNAKGEIAWQPSVSQVSFMHTHKRACTYTGTDMIINLHHRFQELLSFICS